MGDGSLEPRQSGSLQTVCSSSKGVGQAALSQPTARGTADAFPQENLLAAGLGSYSRGYWLGWVGTQDLALQTPPKQSLPGPGTAGILKKGSARAQPPPPAAARMKAEFKIVAEMLKFFPDKEGGTRQTALITHPPPPPPALLISASQLFLLGWK